MSVYRQPVGTLAKLPARTPWWRMLRASIDGTLSRVLSRQFRHAYGIVHDPAEWHRRGFDRRFSDEEIDRHLPPSLRKSPVVPLPGPSVARCA